MSADQITINQPLGAIITPPAMPTPEAFKTIDVTGTAVVVPLPTVKLETPTPTQQVEAVIDLVKQADELAAEQAKQVALQEKINNEPDPIRAVVNTLLVSTSQKAKITNADRIPSNWNLSPGDDEFPVHGSNTITGLLFKGTHAEFNQLLNS